MIYAILVAVLFAGSCMGQFCSIDQKCYIPCPDYTLADAFPFVRQTPVTCEDCMSLCNSLQSGQPPFTCQSAVYDSQYQSCDIFAVSDQSGGGGFGFGRRKRAAPHKQKYPGRIFLQPTGLCAGQGGNGTGSTTPAGGSTGASGASTSGGAATTTAATTTTAGSTTSAAAARKKMLKDQAAIRRRDDIALPNGPCLAHRTSNGKRDCSQGVRQMGRSIVKCVPTHNECMNS